MQWSHYAIKHQGVCLGFDVPDERLEMVRYKARRDSMALSEISFETIRSKVLVTKFAHWRYEDEVRYFLPLPAPAEKGLRFHPFGDDLRLKQIIVGACSGITRSSLEGALGDMTETVETFKARLAFDSFRVVKNKAESFWE